jgi:hypothetical protein
MELEHFDIDTSLDVKSYGPSYGGHYSSFTYVSEDNLSLIIHEYYPATGMLSYLPQHVEEEEEAGFKFMNGQATFKSMASIFYESEIIEFQSSTTHHVSQILVARLKDLNES